MRRGTIGFDTYHYKYDSGREGDGHSISFYPRKGKITIYPLTQTIRENYIEIDLNQVSDTALQQYLEAEKRYRNSSTEE